MSKSMWIRDGILVAAAMTVGWWANGERVQAATASAPEESSYQFMSNNLDNALTVYSPQERTLYVYQGASALGSSHVNCSYKFHIPRIGSALERENCDVGHGLRSYLMGSGCGWA